MITVKQHLQAQAEALVSDAKALEDKAQFLSLEASKKVANAKESRQIAAELQELADKLPA